MFINIGDILVVLTLTSHTQTVEEPSQNNPKPTTKPDGVSADFIMNRRQESSVFPKKKESALEKYMRKFEPATIWERIDKQKKYNGLMLTNEEQSELIFRAMDPTDEIMELNIQNGNPKLILEQDGRREMGWKPPKKPGYLLDRFHVRNRMYELMKQAIYMTRNKMIVMQMYRAKYRNSSLYKMGFMMNKADNAAKTFGQFSSQAYRSCMLVIERVMYRLALSDLLSVNERQLNLWFNVEILGDLIMENDKIAHTVFRNYSRNRTAKFDKYFID